MLKIATLPNDTLKVSVNVLSYANGLKNISEVDLPLPQMICEDLVHNYHNDVGIQLKILWWSFHTFV